MSTGILVTTYNRPGALERSLPQITALGAPVLVVDDGSSFENEFENRNICAADNCEYLLIPQNRGLAVALNVGLSYWLADKRVEWISYFQDDVDVHPATLRVLEALHSRGVIMSGHDAGEHVPHRLEGINGTPVKFKWAIRATHMHARRDFWLEQLPIPTNEIGTPKKKGDGVRGMGSNVDWWIVRDGPRSCKATNRPILCVPNLVRSFLWRGVDSCWNNTSRAGEEPPLSEQWRS